MNVAEIDREIAALQKKIANLNVRRNNALYEAEDLMRQETVKSKLSVGYLNIKDAAKYLGIDAPRLRMLIARQDVSAERIGGRDYISPRELEDIKNGEWLGLTCKGTWSNGVICSFPVVRASEFCGKHHPDRHLMNMIEVPHQDRAKVKLLLAEKCVLCGDKATKAIGRWIYCDFHPVTHDPDFARAINAEVDLINADLLIHPKP